MIFVQSSLPWLGVVINCDPINTSLKAGCAAVSSGVYGTCMISNNVSDLMASIVPAFSR